MTEHFAPIPAVPFPKTAEPIKDSSIAEGVLVAGATAIVAAEITPLNEAIRLGAAGAVEMAASNPWLTTATATGATFIIEAGAAVATAALLNTEKGQKVAEWVSRKAAKVNIGTEGVQTGPIADLGIGLMFGSAVATFAKHAQDPERTKFENIRFGVKNAAEVSAVVAVPAFAVAEGIDTVGPEVVGGTILTLAGVATAVRAIRRHKVRTKKQTAEIDLSTSQVEVEEGEYPIRYDLTKEEVAASQAEMASAVRERYGNKVVAVWLSSHSKHANTIRTLEVEKFPELPEIMRSSEEESGFLAIVDARKGANRIVRGTRISNPMFNRDQTDASVASELKTAMIQGLVESGQITREEINEYYERAHVDLEHTISVESNFKVGERAKRVKGIPLAHLSYLAMVKYCLEKVRGQSDVVPSILAHVNEATTTSLGRLGVEFTPFAGRDDLRTPSTEGHFDDDYRPVCIPYTPKNQKAFKRLRHFALPQMQL